MGLRTAAAVPGGQAYPLHDDPPLLRATLDAMAATGLRVRTVEMVSLSRDTSAGELRPMLEAAARLGATRVLCTGNDTDSGVVTEAFAILCATAAEFGMSADLEFMRFRSVQTLEQACAVVEGSGAPNGTLVLDCLHLIRSGGTPAKVRALPAGRIGNLQLCDAPASPPSDGDLANEARQNRLPPGEGELPLRSILEAAGPVAAIDAEVPLGGRHGALSVDAKAALIHAATVRLLATAPSGGA